MNSPTYQSSRPRGPGRVQALAAAAIAILTLLAGSSPARADVFLMGSQLGISPTGGWQTYTGNDAPPPGFLGFLNAGTNTLTATVPLGQTLQPGNYILSLRVLNYDANGTFTATLGGATATGSFNDRDYNYIWTPPTVMAVQSPTSSLTVVFNRTYAPSIAQKYLFTGLFISTNLNLVVLKSDKLVELNYPTAADYDDTPARPGNLIPNGSFEGGIGSGWGIEGNPRTFTLDQIWSTDSPYHGKGCLRIALPTRQIHTLIHAPIRVRPNRIHTFSAYVKAAQPMAVTLFVTNSFSPPAGFPPGQSMQQRFVISNNWTRLTLSNRFLKYPESEYAVELTFESVVDNTVWVDAVQLEEGPASPFVPQFPTELAIRQSRLGNLYFEDENVTAPVVVVNQTPLPRTTTLDVQINDWHNRTQFKTNFQVSLAANGSYEYNAPIPQNRKGSFRVLASLRNPSGTQAESVFTVVPRPPPTSYAPDSRIGIHANFVPWQMSMLRSLGVQWIRGMSPGAYFRFAVAQPTEGNFDWADDEVAVATANNIEIMGTLSQYPPAWAERTYITVSNVVGSGFVVGENVLTGNGASGRVTVVLTDANPTGHALQMFFVVGSLLNGDTIRGTTSGTTAKISSPPYPKSVGLDKWSTLVRNVVDHYKSAVSAWEIANEPDKDPAGVPLPGGDPGFYTEMLIRAITEITNVAPNSRIIAMGGAFATNWFDRVAVKLTPAQRAAIYGFSTHLYPSNEDLAPGHTALAQGKYGKASWNTETAVWDLGLHSGPGSNFRYEGIPVQPFRYSERFYKGHWLEASAAMRNLWVCLGVGMDRYFYYDARQIASPSYYDTSPSFFDYDETLRVKAAAYSVSANLLAGSQTAGRVTYTDARARAYVFSRANGSSFVTLFSTAITNQYTLPLPAAVAAASPQFLDMMGNAIPLSAGGAVFNGKPSFLLTSLSATDLRAALATVAPALSVDQEAPQLSINQYPMGVPGPGSAFEFRWLGIDNLDVPTINRPEPVTYSYRVVGYDSNWSAWTPHTSLFLSNLPKGAYEVQVKARDSVGNESPVVSEAFWVTEPPAAPTGVQVGS